MLDLGTGSGAVALAIAAEWPAAVLTATDASAAALDRARANAAALGLAARVRFVPGHWFDAVGEDDRFEVVVSNPPYIAAGEWDALPEDVRGFEPPTALLAGPRGLDDLRAIVDAAPRHLVPGGLLALELAETRAARGRRLAGRLARLGGGRGAARPGRAPALPARARRRGISKRVTPFVPPGGDDAAPPRGAACGSRLPEETPTPAA